MAILAATQYFAFSSLNNVQPHVLFTGCFSNQPSEPGLEGFPAALLTAAVLERFSEIH